MGKKKKAKRKLNILRLLLLIFLIVTFITAGAGIGVIMGIISKLPEYDFNDPPQWNITTFVYDSEGKLIAKLHGNENREPVEFEKIPQSLKDAFIAIEDSEFYNHFGIDPKAILRAAWANFKYGWGTQGGSTITQQLAKNAFLKNPEKSLKRKIQEALMAIQLERNFTKDEIFEMYLNQIYFGHGAHGVQAAAKTYFGKDVSDLTLAESAMLAGIVKAPARYSPYSNKEEAKKRRAVVLNRMAELGKISQEEADKAEEAPFNLIGLRQARTYKYPYFVDHVIEEAEQLLRANNIEETKLYTGGLKVYTTLNRNIQEKIEEVFNNPEYFPEVDTKEPVQSAMVVLDPHTGAIQGLIGGREHVTKRGLNRATQMKRQPGSSIKPLVVYAPALESGLTPATVVDDVPVSYPVPGQENYEPKNYDGRYRGLISMREAVRWSVNIPAVKFLDQIGVTTGYEFGKNLGLPLAQTDRNLSLALGGLTKGITPLNMAAAYGTFANKGVYIEPYAVSKIVDSEGNVLVKHKPQKRIVMSEKTAYLITDILTTVVKDSKGRTGTGWRAAIPGWPVAGKTGTTQLPDTKEFEGLKGNRDAWFAGYTPEYVAVVWMGYDETDKNHYLKRVYGGTYPAKIWKAVMREALKDKEPKQFERPEDIVSVAIDTKSGLLPSELTPEEFIQMEIFDKTTVPQKVSDIWVEVEVCAETGKLFTPFCPDVVTKTLFKRPIPYNGDKKPEDAEWEVPTEYCDVHTNTTTALLSTCADPRHEGKLVLANIPAPGQEGGCPEEYIVHRVFAPGTAPKTYCDLKDHQVIDPTTGNIVKPRTASNQERNDAGQSNASGNATEEMAEQEENDRVPPPAPKLFGRAGKSERGTNGVSVQLQWEIDQEQVTDKQEIVYFIERWTDLSTNKLNIALTNDLTWEDKEVKPGTTYHYRVTAIDVNTSLTAQSNSITVEVPETD
ncbi:MAG: PBP1A family penicillin-binding protein [Thermoanaerobacteraceae bacterium]|nr:PBP1A family penicillin-binding protein [Thermoanaerobacteraceae bacterium]